MRKYIGIVVCLLICCQLSAVTYGSLYQPQPFHSTSAYVDQSYAVSMAMEKRTVTMTRPVGSLSSISASNFESLNSEGGACYAPTAAGPRRGRSGGSIGEYEFHSPVGPTPWLMMLLLAAIYGIYKKNRKKVQKNLAES